jgi:LysM repeat protein
VTSSSSSLPRVDEEKTKGRIWNGYVCPGCRTVFRVAADFIGTDVMCPSCKETLRLPKTPEEAKSSHSSTETSTVTEAATISAKRVKLAKLANTEKPARQPDPAHDNGPSARHTMPSTSNRRLNLILALLLLIAVSVSALLFFPSKESTPEKAGVENTPLVQPETKAPREPAPLPPPIAVSEMPIPVPSIMPEPQETPVPELAFVQPVTEPVTELVENAPKVPEPAAAVDTSETGLVEAIPATPATPVPAPETPVPAPEISAPPSTVQPEPEVTVAPAALVHTVVRGDTLNKLSRKYQVSIATIKKANRMKSDAVMLGQKLNIPGASSPAAEPTPAKTVETPPQAPQAARSHTIVRGDTLERIARKYGVTSQQVMQANGMKNDVVRLGRKLVIPAAP